MPQRVSRPWSLADEAKRAARRLGLRLRPHEIEAIESMGGFIVGDGKIFPSRTDSEFRTLNYNVPLEWPPGKILRARNKLRQAIRSGQPVPIRIQYSDGRSPKTVMEPAWDRSLLDVPRDQGKSRRRAGAPKLVSDDKVEEAVRQRPNDSARAIADGVIRTLPKVPTKWTVARLLKRIEAAKKTTKARPSSKP